MRNRPTEMESYIAGEDEVTVKLRWPSEYFVIIRAALQKLERHLAKKGRYDDAMRTRQIKQEFERLWL